MKLESAANTKKTADFIQQLVIESAGSSKLAALYVGHRLGYYRELAGSNGLTDRELAERTSNRVVFVREWLQQQAVDGVINVTHPSNSKGEHRYQLPLEYCDVLTNLEGPPFLRGPLEAVNLDADPVVNHWLQSAPIPAADRRISGRDGAGLRVKRAMRSGFGDVMNLLKVLRPRIQDLSAKS